MRITAFVLATALASAPFASLRAEPSAAEIAAARELFDEGLALEQKGDWQGALDRFRKVAGVKMTPQVRFHIALCLENLGKLVDALVEFERAKSDAAADPTAQLVATTAQKHVVDLKERVPRVIVKVPAGTENVAVTIDGTPVSSALLGSAIPLDPGKHQLVVTANKQPSFTKDVELVEHGKTTTIEVTFAPAAKVEKPPPPPKEEPPKEEPTEGSHGPGALPWIFGGIGVAALAGGGIFYGLRQSTISDLEGACGPDRNQCPEDKKSTYDRGKTYTTVGNILLGVGVVGVATAVVILVASPSKSGDKKSASAAVTLGGGPGNIGLGLIGRF
ncbi:MAG: hypothetical protein ACXVEF_42355 [Polyangiales bacterium]